MLRFQNLQNYKREFNLGQHGDSELLKSFHSNIQDGGRTRNINNKKDPQKKHRLGTVSKNNLLEGLKYLYGANLTLISHMD